MDLIFRHTIVAAGHTFFLLKSLFLFLRLLSYLIGKQKKAYCQEKKNTLHSLIHGGAWFLLKSCKIKTLKADMAEIVDKPSEADTFLMYKRELF